MGITRFPILFSFFLFIGSVRSVDLNDIPALFKNGDLVTIEAYKLVSSLTLLTYDYYDLPFCRPEEIKFKKSGYSKNKLNIMETANSLYKARCNETNSCEELKSERGSCTRTYTEEELSMFIDLITRKYRSHFIVDGIPASIIHVSYKPTRLRFEPGVPIGAQGLDGTIYLHNHLDFKFHYGVHYDGRMFISAVEIMPGSIDEDDYDTKSKCFRGNPLVIGKKWRPIGPKKVRWTYSIEWVRRNDVELNFDRVSVYDMEKSFNAHWISMFNTVVVSFFVLVLLGIFLVHIFNPSFSFNFSVNDIEGMKGNVFEEGEVRMARYNKSDDESDPDSSMGNFDEFDDDTTGKNKNVLIWRHIKRELTTVPRCPLLLSLLVGIGLQGFVSLCCVVIAFIFGTDEVSSLRHLVYIFCATVFSIGSVVSGFINGRLCKTFRMKQFIIPILLNIVTLPMALFCFSYVLRGSYRYFDPLIATLETLGKKLMLVSPITAVCHCIGRRLPPFCVLRPRKRYDDEVRRKSEGCSCMLSPILNSAMSGAFPFGAKFIGISFSVFAVWSYQEIDVGSFTMHLVAGTLVVCSAINISSLCFMISSNNARSWWWSAFQIDGFSAIYTALYVIIYYKNRVTFADNTSKTVYFTYSFFAILAHYIMSAAVSFIATFIFVRKISSRKRQ